MTRVASYILQSNKIKSFPNGLTLHIENQIPFGRGLGSSGEVVIAGVKLGNILGNFNLTKKLYYALMVERDPDNVTAAVLGGFVASYLKELLPEDLYVISIPLAQVLPEFPIDEMLLWLEGSYTKQLSQLFSATVNMLSRPWDTQIQNPKFTELGSIRCYSVTFLNLTPMNCHIPP
ncbi:uncharacterized protein MELLADRAFT_71856 [Melampsora larici-populina 98AG31]|uniref:GHMP kinase N-terminal domain-containing protein n=1 Tax=Melampsora larici-populina (strain 98AG31 / pathotype 3-4-7) TaxID=747676 RepID=F4RL49_MELLP|nr:uncharacterized protein MELLADRAFT_71856 [Melampsora larici-populina 98AG31]EGG06929.1 hypothetical protein MELLADRAFT_71856 [Melampsora larici-populina 98AG31]